MRVALALHVAGGEDAVPPGGFRTVNRGLLVIDAVVAKNFRLSRIGGSDLPAAMNEAFRLIKVNGFGDIIRNDGIVLPKFGYTIDLDG